jgi:pimaricinolide synthase PimS1
VEDVLRGVPGAPGLERIDVLQPVLFAVVVALADLWRACGVRPAAVVGHSQGEIAAAYVAGGLSLEDAARVVALRSRALVGLVGRGAIASVGLGLEELRPRLDGWGGRIVVSAVNGPASVGVAGDVEALEGLLGELEAEGVRARLVAGTVASHSPQAEVVREELLEALASLVPRSGEIPFCSTVTGGLVDTAELGGEYWFRNLREPVRFERGVRALLEDGQRTFIEMSPHPVLTMGAQETVDDVLGDPGGALVIGSLRRGEGGAARFLTSLGEAWTRGVEVDWGRVFEGSGAQPVKLPKYAFQRERYWLTGPPEAADLTSAGVCAAKHPLLGAMVELAAGEQPLFTGRLSVREPAWLADHLVFELPVAPGVMFVELALYAGSQVECDLLEELVVEAPLVLPLHGSVTLQVAVGEQVEGGRRSVTIFARPDHVADDGTVGSGEWTRHASGSLLANEFPTGEHARAEERAAALGGGVWPPPDAQAVAVDDIYEEAAVRGVEYRSSFNVVRRAWRHGEEMLAEIALSEDEREQASAYGVHPALMDGALQLRGFLGKGTGGDERAPGGVLMPFSFSGVEFCAPGASSLRVSALPLGPDAVSVVVADETGRLVAFIDSLVTREISAEQLGAARGALENGLFGVAWDPVAAVSPHSPEYSPDVLHLVGEEHSALAESLREGGHRIEVCPDLSHLREALREEATPDAVFVDCGPVAMPGDCGDSIDLSAVHYTVHGVLELAQGWLREERFADSRLVLITRGAIAVDPATDPPCGLAGAPVWGLMRSAQAESPGRFVLLDIDRATSGGELLGALHRALASHEPQLVVRRGEIAVPRLRALGPAAALEGAVGEGPRTGLLDPDGTALITGGTGTLGGLIARHLVERHHVGRLLLVSRAGAEAKNATGLRAELEELGATVQIAACDVSDREALKAVVESVSVEHPLTAVVHAAGVLDSGLIDSMTAARVDRALAAKADGAWHLHELVGDSPLGAFVLFSSAAGLLGGAGQAGYAAANAFLDGLAAHRRARGLTASSIAWGLWAGISAMTEDLSEADRRRVVGLGMRELTHEQGLALFDMALDSRQALVLAATLDPRTLRAQARTGALAAMLTGLVRVPKRRSGKTEESLAQRLAAAPEAEREGVVRDLVRAGVGMVLGHDSPEQIDERRSFKELGFDSLSAVELRNRLNAITGLRLQATLVFDHPTPEALARYLLGRIVVGDAVPAAAAPGSALVELDRLERTLSAPVLDDLEREQITRRLRALVAGVAGEEVTVEDDLDTSTAEEVFAAMDRELGVA